MVEMQIAQVGPRVQPIDNEGYILGALDSATRTTISMDQTHHELHEGHLFKVDDDATLADEATRELLFTTPNSSLWVHLWIKKRGTGETEFRLFEDTTVSANGTVKTPYDKNRVNGATPICTIHHTPTVTTDGTEISKTLFGAGKKIGGEDKNIDGWILKQNAKYLLRTTSAAADNITSIELVWVEHTSLV